MSFEKTFVGRDIKIAFHQHPNATGVVQYRVDYSLSGGLVVSHYLPFASGVEEEAEFEGDTMTLLAFTDILNFAENQANSTGGIASREVDISIFTQHASGVWSAGETVLTGIAENPAPDEPTVVLTSTPQGIEGRVVPAAEAPDLAYHLIWISETASIDTGAVDPTFRQVSEVFSFPIDDDTPRYVKAAVVDHFGETPLNVSDEESASRSTFNATSIDEQIDILNGMISLTDPTAGSIGARFIEAEEIIEDLDTNFASAARATALEAQMAGTSGSNLSSRIGSLETVTTNGTFAAASALSTLNSTVGGHTSTLSTLASTVSSLEDGYALASYEVSAAASGGLPTRLSLTSSTYGSNIALEASEIFFGDNTTFDNATDTLTTTFSGVKRIIAWGAPFGVDDDLIEWQGDDTIDLADVTRANANFYQAITAPYVGGSAVPTAGAGGGVTASTGFGGVGFSVAGSGWQAVHSFTLSGIPLNPQIDLSINPLSVNMSSGSGADIQWRMIESLSGTVIGLPSSSYYWGELMMNDPIALGGGGTASGAVQYEVQARLPSSFALMSGSVQLDFNAYQVL